MPSFASPRLHEVLNHPLTQVLTTFLTPRTQPIDDRYELVTTQRLGKEANASVVPAVRRCDSRSVAVKMIPLDNARKIDLNSGRNNNNNELIWIEPAVLHHLKGVKGVIGLEDVYVTSTHLYVVMERPFNAVELTTLVRAEKRLTEDQARFIFHQMVNTLLDVRAKGIYHGDLKMSNVLVNPTTMAVTLIDFGCADAITPGGCADYCGSKLFSPPEWRLKDRLTADGLSVWSLGVMLHRVVFGRPAFWSLADTLEGIMCVAFWPTLGKIYYNTAFTFQ